MPIYEYLCQDCGVLSEKRRSMAQRDDPFKCPECGSMNTKKAISTFAANTEVDPRNLRGSGKADFDRVVGRNAEMRWNQINAEAQKKAEARERFGQPALGRTADGEYKPVPKEKIEQRKEGYKKFEYAKKHGTKIVHDS